MRALICAPLLAVGCSAVIGIDDVALEPEGAACLVAARFAAVALNDDSLAVARRTENGSIVLVAPLDAGALPDMLVLQLVVGDGAFSTRGIGPGSYTIAGAERDYESCGVCALIYADVAFDDDGETRPSAKYLANAGRVELHEVETRLVAELHGVALREVIIAEDLTTTDSASGCRAVIDEIHIDVAYSEE